MSTEKPGLQLAANPDHEIPDAEGADASDVPALPPLRIGPPFAVADECDLLESHEAAPGCVAVMRCGADGCSQVFKFSLLSANEKRCPRCKTAYTHCLLVAPMANAEVVGAAIVQVMEANGFAAPDLGDADDADEDEDEESDEDDEGAEDDASE